MKTKKTGNFERKSLAALAAKKALRVAGLMSGTSADGVDVVVADIGPGGVGVVAFDSFPYPKAVRKLVFELFDPQTARVEAVCHANFVLGEVFAEAVLRLCREQGVKLASIDLIGSHGQTVCHLPQGRRFGGRLVRSTLQIGEPSVIAERTGITTVADFRPRDVAAGGEGAPLVPYTDWLLFADRRKTRCVQNIGGIANVTYLPAGGGVEKVLAFDTGPGNMIIDRLVWLATKGKRNFDKDGKMAARGRVDAKLLAGLMQHRYLRRRPPKSTGREEFGVEFSTKLYARTVARGMEPQDLIATATAFTARSIAEAYRRFLPGRPDEVILCGGGARNPTLVEMIRAEFPGSRVGAMDEWGINADAKEAISFALLARETIRGAAGNVPAATGARRRVVLGKIVPGGSTGV
jgi:anhydro-N-acetylmuramic acid kinase